MMRYSTHGQLAAGLLSLSRRQRLHRVIIALDPEVCKGILVVSLLRLRRGVGYHTLRVGSNRSDPIDLLPTVENAD